MKGSQFYSNCAEYAGKPQQQCRSNAIAARQFRQGHSVHARPEASRLATLHLRVLQSIRQSPRTVTRAEPGEFFAERSTRFHGG